MSAKDYLSFGCFTRQLVLPPPLSKPRPWEQLGSEEMPSDVSSSERSHGSDGEGGSGAETSDTWDTDSSSDEASGSSAFSTDVSDTRKRRRKAGVHLTCVGAFDAVC